ncbi:MAG: polysaccharide biosynthesis/export protein [Chthoniobacter sp.]|jgi:protein involved in polysaccharide export with SLBB domain|nr:polysaccharide biosynthesis/export protein [Chthoniobacter sp.]
MKYVIFALGTVVIWTGVGVHLALGQPLGGPAERPPSGGSVATTVGLTNSMDVLNDKTKLNNGDRLSFRVVEERKEPIPLMVTDSGEIEVPFIGRVSAAGKTCKQLAHEIKPLLEKEYFFRATVIIGLDTLSTRSRGKVYLMGQLKTQGAMDIPADEVLTVSKVILRAGGLADFANRRKVKLVRKNAAGATDTTIVDLVEILDKGRMEKDPVIEPDDLIVVPERLINF